MEKPSKWNHFCNTTFVGVRFLKSKINSGAKTDEELISHFRQFGEETDIEILFDRYCHLVFAVCMNHFKNEEESKDAVIEIFGKMPTDLKKYDIKNFSAWIYSVTRNYCYQELNKKKRNHVESMDTADGKNAEIWMASDLAEDDSGKMLLNHLDEALQTLNDEQRTCITLFYLEEKSYEEIEQATGYDYNKVKSHIQNGKRNLKIYLEKKKNEQR